MVSQHRIFFTFSLYLSSLLPTTNFSPHHWCHILLHHHPRPNLLPHHHRHAKKMNPPPSKEPGGTHPLSNLPPSLPRNHSISDGISLFSSCKFLQSLFLTSSSFLPWWWRFQIEKVNI